MNEYDYVIFEIEDCRLAIPSQLVDKVERAVLLTPVPDAPKPVLGVLSDGGEIIPVLGLRSRLGFEEREIVLSDRLLFSRFGERRVAILADSVRAVTEIFPDSLREAREIWPGVVYLKAIAGLGGDVVMMQDMDAVLDPEQLFKLDEALLALRTGGDEGPADG